ncbi:MAG: hypothetical protein FE78DRAFT_497013 [Acidomyces sp. 'richmondensis']|nr:MAG: hypothetical protein FE78DRAFT_497013 [Acidomyces sp. 'richmondensis']
MRKPFWKDVLERAKHAMASYHTGFILSAIQASNKKRPGADGIYPSRRHHGRLVQEVNDPLKHRVQLR